jgi:hypothetical protein
MPGDQSIDGDGKQNQIGRQIVGVARKDFKEARSAGRGRKSGRSGTDREAQRHQQNHQPSESICSSQPHRPTYSSRGFHFARRIPGRIGLWTVEKKMSEP